MNLKFSFMEFLAYSVAFSILLDLCAHVLWLSNLRSNTRKWRHPVDRKSDKKLAMSTTKACKLLMSLTGILCLLGLPWITIGVAKLFLHRTVTHLVFIIYHLLQGFLLFMFFTAINPELRNQWIKFLCRCWVKKKHTSIPKHKAQSIWVNNALQRWMSEKQNDQHIVHLTCLAHVLCINTLYNWSFQQRTVMKVRSLRLTPVNSSLPTAREGCMCKLNNSTCTSCASLISLQPRSAHGWA